MEDPKEKIGEIREEKKMFTKTITLYLYSSSVHGNAQEEVFTRSTTE